MLTEDIGGECPACEYDRVLFRYGSTGYYHYIACPNCGFAYGENTMGVQDYGKDVWYCILPAYEEMLIANGYDVSVVGIKKFTDKHKKEYLNKEIGTMYDFSGEELEKFTPKEDLGTINLKNIKNL